jgi:hypothetical protein
MAIRCSACNAWLTTKKTAQTETKKEHIEHQEPAPKVQQQADSQPNLIPCPDCGQDVSPNAEHCPKCGAPRRVATVQPAQPDILKLIEMTAKAGISLIILIGILGFLFGGSDSDDTTAEVVEERVLTPEEQREKQISRQFNAWDGSHIELRKYVKARLHDPSSFEHVISRSWDQKDHLVVSMEYRAANGFGALRRSVIKAKVTLDGTIIEIMDNYTM